MAITITVNESPTYVTVNETNNSVILNQSDNPIQVTTSLDLIAANADQINVDAIGNIIPAGTVANALGVLADQFFRSDSAPTGSNLEEGDLWYDTDDDQLMVYRETSPGNLEFVPLAQATGTMNNLDGGLF
tara:strand:+ start:1022 stop:1414 length:393 start_codon:yes stop_codon:yes gene_type:complete